MAGSLPKYPGKVYLCKMNAERTISFSSTSTIVAVILNLLETLSDSESSEESSENERIDFQLVYIASTFSMALS